LQHRADCRNIRCTHTTTGNFFAGYILSGADASVATALAPQPEADREELLRATTIAVVATNARLTKAQANSAASLRPPTRGRSDGEAEAKPDALRAQS